MKDTLKTAFVIFPALAKSLAEAFSVGGTFHDADLEFMMYFDKIMDDIRNCPEDHYTYKSQSLIRHNVMTTALASASKTDDVRLPLSMLERFKDEARDIGLKLKFHIYVSEPGARIGLKFSSPDGRPLNEIYAERRPLQENKSWLRHILG